MALTLEKLKLKISASKFSGEQKEWLLEKLENFGENTKAFLNRQISENNFESTKNDLFDTFRETLNAIEEFEQGDADKLVTILKQSPESPDYGSGMYVLPIVADAKATNPFRQKLTSNVQDSLNAFELALFQNLPYGELVDLVQNNILYFVRHLNIVMEFKKLYFVPSLYGQMQWIWPFVPALEANKEVIGVKEIDSGEKQLPPTVSNWLKDYVVFSSSAGGSLGRGGYGQVKYVQQSPNIKLLNEEEKAELTNVIKLYEWFISPSVTEAELDAYYKEQHPEIAAVAPEEKVREEKKPVQQETAEKTQQEDIPAAKSEPETQAAPLPQPEPTFTVPVKPEKEERSQQPAKVPFAVPKFTIGAGGASSNLQEILKKNVEKAETERGIKIDSEHKIAPVKPGSVTAAVPSPKPVDMEAIRVAAEKRKKETEEKIEKKLQDLKNKTIVNS